MENGPFKDRGDSDAKRKKAHNRAPNKVKAFIEEASQNAGVSARLLARARC